MRRASAMPCRVTEPANPNGSSWWRPSACDGSKQETKRLEFFIFRAGSWEHDHWIAQNSNCTEKRKNSPGPNRGPRSSLHFAVQNGVQPNFHLEKRGKSQPHSCNWERREWNQYLHGDDERNNTSCWSNTTTTQNSTDHTRFQCSNPIKHCSRRAFQTVFLPSRLGTSMEVEI